MDVGDNDLDPGAGVRPLSSCEVTGKEEPTENAGNPQTNATGHILLPTQPKTQQTTTQKTSESSSGDDFDAGNDDDITGAGISNDHLDPSLRLDDYRPGKDEEVNLDQTAEVYEDLSGSPDRSEGAKIQRITSYRWTEGFRSLK